MCAEAARPVWHADLEPIEDPSLWSEPEGMEPTARLLTIDRAAFTIRRQAFPNPIVEGLPVTRGATRNC